MEAIESLSLLKSIHRLFSEQLEIIIQTELASTSDHKSSINSEINKLQEQYDKIEFKYATDEISVEVYEKHGSKLKAQINQKKKLLAQLPTKMSNFKKKMKFFLKIADNPREFYESLDYHQKRLFQKLIFPEGFRFSMKNKECRTQRMNLLFELSSSFANKYNECKKETQAKKLLESHLVAGTGLEPVTFGL